MNRIHLILLATLLSIIGVTSAVAETQPGDACAAGQINQIRLSGGPETTGVGHLLRCDGTTWIGLTTWKQPNYIGLGTAQPTLNSAAGTVLHLHASGGNPAVVHFSNASTGADATDGALIGRSPDASNLGLILGTYENEPITFITNSLERVYIDGSGRVGIGVTPSVALDVGGSIEYTGTILDASDRRLKSHIAPLSKRGSMLNRLNGIKTYSFRMKDDPQQRVEFGVMAQDLAEIFPELVSANMSTQEGYLSVNYVGLITPLIAAMQEQQAIIEDMQQTLHEQQRRIEWLIESDASPTIHGSNSNAPALDVSGFRLNP